MSKTKPPHAKAKYFIISALTVVLLAGIAIMVASSENQKLDDALLKAIFSHESYNNIESFKVERRSVGVDVNVEALVVMRDSNSARIAMEDFTESGWINTSLSEYTLMLPDKAIGKTKDCVFNPKTQKEHHDAEVMCRNDRELYYRVWSD